MLVIVLTGIVLLISVSLIGSDKYRNFIGSIKGYGSCGNCHGTWDWKAHHTFHYDDETGMFPLCEDCFQNLPISEIKKHIEHLVNKEWTGVENPENIIFKSMVAACKDKGKINAYTVEDYNVCKPYFEASA